MQINRIHVCKVSKSVMQSAADTLEPEAEIFIEIIEASSLIKALDSPYGELKFAPPNPYFIDLRQMEANLIKC